VAASAQWPNGQMSRPPRVPVVRVRDRTAGSHERCGDQSRWTRLRPKVSRARGTLGRCAIERAGERRFNSRAAMPGSGLPAWSLSRGVPSRRGAGLPARRDSPPVRHRAAPPTRSSLKIHA
jgi:hypothetical protein